MNYNFIHDLNLVPLINQLTLCYQNIYLFIPGNLSDKNIIQFSLYRKAVGKQVKVNNVNLLVRVKMKKSRKSKRTVRGMDAKINEKQRHKKKFKEVDILVSNVTETGTPDKVITSVKSKIRKTKSLKISIPKEIIQSVLNSNKNSLQFFVRCIGCDKNTKMILVHKRRKKRLAKTSGGSKDFKLHKRRPILFVYSHRTTRI